MDIVGEVDVSVFEVKTDIDVPLHVAVAVLEVPSANHTKTNSALFELVPQFAVYVRDVTVKPPYDPENCCWMDMLQIYCPSYDNSIARINQCGWC